MQISDIAIVLVEPQEPGNIGAAARAMANMGLERLLLVRPVDFDCREACRMALGGSRILARAKSFSALRDALVGFDFVVGTTRREGFSRRARVSPRVVARELLQVGVENRSAILFGREDRGLTNKELEPCHRIVAIPASADNPSLNLSQAVLLVAYELFLAFNSEDPEALLSPAVRKLAPTERLEEFYAHMEDTLTEIGYLHANNPKRMMRSFRRLFGRAGLDEREVRALRGIFHQIEWYVREKRKSVQEMEC